MDPYFDRQYDFVKKENPFELDHLYGENIHILYDIEMLSLINSFASINAIQFEKFDYLYQIYRRMMGFVMHREMPTTWVISETPMAQYEGEQGYYRGPILNRATEVVIIDILRGGVHPVATLQHKLSAMLGKEIRADHIIIQREHIENQGTCKAQILGQKIDFDPSKIKGAIEDKIVLIPDPMAATGSSIIEWYNLYKDKENTISDIRFGKPKKIIGLHLVICPEYVKSIRKSIPELIIYAARMDRGLSPQAVLQTKLGTSRDLEKGLNENCYIVPGLGDVGRILSGSEFL